MEPAPAQAPVITMPDPHRVVTRSVAMLTRQGFTERQALHITYRAARHAWAALTAISMDDIGWLRLIWQDAEARPGFTTSPDTDTAEAHHGDET